MRSPSAIASSSARLASGDSGLLPGGGRLSSPLSLGSLSGLVDGLVSATDCGSLVGVRKHDTGTLDLGAGSPDGIGSYLRCLVGLLIGSLN